MADLENAHGKDQRMQKLKENAQLEISGYKEKVEWME